MNLGTNTTGRRGQWEGTVIPPALPSKVQILHPPPCSFLVILPELGNGFFQVSVHFNVKRFALLLSSLMLLSGLASPASAVENGISALGDLKVVAPQPAGSNTPFCTAALLSEYILVSAAHCFTVNTGGEDSPVRTEPFTVSLPGVDASSDDINTRVKVMKIVVPSGYDNIWKPDQGDTRTQVDDIAFLFLEKPLVPNYQIQVATQFEVRQLKANHSPVTSYGYGLQGKNQQDGKPYKITLNASKRNGNSIVDYEKMISLEEVGGALCPGDSGGPSYAEINGVTKLVSDTVGAGGCRGIEQAGSIDLHTLVAPYLELAKQEWEKYAQENKITHSPIIAFNAIELGKAQEKMVADAENSVIGQLVQRDFQSTCCHHKSATMILEIKTGETWSEMISASKVIFSSPSETEVGRAFVTAQVPIGSYVRWHIFVRGAFDYYGQPEKISITSIEEAQSLLNAKAASDKVAADLKAKQEAEAKAAANKVAANKKIAITCVKGKLAKKVTAVKPKCPNGYKLKQ